MPVEPTLEIVNQWFGGAVPLNKALGMSLVELVEDGAVARLPFAEHLVGNPDTGYLHGGVITTLIDATCGVAVFAAIKQPLRIATLDLRIDYLEPSTPRADVLCKAICYKHTRQIAFVRALAHHGDEAEPIASAAGTFMIFGAARSTPEPPDGEAAP